MSGILLVFLCFNSVAQLPNTDIWLLDIKKDNNKIELSNPINITNRKGYDNQPAFSPDGKYLLYTSVKEDNQSDIYKYDLTTKSISQFTKTTVSEYSPTFMPDGKNISVVMVEKDSTQRLWKYPLSGGPANALTPDIDSIGYHCWMNADSIALIMITNPPTLEIANIKTQKHKIIAKDVGRCMTSLSLGTLDYIQKKDSVTFNLCNFDKNKKDIIKDFYKLPSEDFAFLLFTEPTYITGKGSKVNASFLFQKKDKVLLDLANKNIHKITRIAVSKDGLHLAIVAE